MIRFLGNLPRHLNDPACYEELGVAYEPIARSNSVLLANVMELWRVARRACGFDAILFFQDEKGLLILCALKALLPGHVPLVSIDLISIRPLSRRDRIKAAVKKFLLRQVDLFLLHVKESAGYREFLGIGPDRLQYVPYHVKQWPEVLRVTDRRENYVLSCGRSRRDYPCLIEAVRGLPYPVKILAPRDADLAYHRSDPLDALPRLASNVEIVHDDGSYQSWLTIMASCRMVVLPLNRASMCAEGVGTYLAAMALGKAVVISRTDAVTGIIDGGESVVVPPSDPLALREAIVRLWEDEAYRKSIASKGYAHAARLGGEKDLQRNILRAVVNFLGSGGPTKRDL